jgi:hypothetical protein
MLDLRDIRCATASFARPTDDDATHDRSRNAARPMTGITEARWDALRI